MFQCCFCTADATPVSHVQVVRFDCCWSSAELLLLITHEVMYLIDYCSAFPRLPIALDGKVVEIAEDTDVAEVFAPLLLLAPTVEKDKKMAKAVVERKLVRTDNNKQQKLKKRKRT